MEQCVWNFEETTDGFKIEIFDTKTKRRYVGTAIDIIVALNDEKIERAKKHAKENGLIWNEEDMKKEVEMQIIKEHKFFFNFMKELIEKKKYTMILTDEIFICKFNSDDIRIDTFVDDDSKPICNNNVLVISLKRVLE